LQFFLLERTNPHAVQDTLLEEICGLGNIERRPPSPTRIEI
jgi:hypothetical protein